MHAEHPLGLFIKLVQRREVGRSDAQSSIPGSRDWYGSAHVGLIDAALAVASPQIDGERDPHLVERCESFAVELAPFNFTDRNSVPRNAGSAPPQALLVDCLHAKIINEEDGIELGQREKFLEAIAEHGHVLR